MTIQLPKAFVTNFKSMYVELAQQQESRLEGKVRVATGVTGKSDTWDRIGAFEARQVTTRNSDTVLQDVPHSRRIVRLKDWDCAVMIDRLDLPKLKASPRDEYMRGLLSALNRRKDSQIIAAATGNATSVDEDDAQTSIALPDAQKLVSGAEGLTVKLLRDARRIIKASDVDDDEELFFVITAQQEDDLFGDTNNQITSSDFNDTKPLVSGTIRSFMGFNFIRSERLGTDASTGQRKCFAWARTGIGLSVGQDVSIDVGPRRDKRAGLQLLADFSLEATRIEDEKLVQVDCTEPA